MRPSLSAGRSYGACFITAAGKPILAAAPSVDFLRGDTRFLR